MKIDLSGLDKFRSSILTDVDLPPVAVAPGERQYLELELIDFDPEQPRKEIKQEAIEEMAASIKVHGVLQPVSVRASTTHPGRYVINMGERRVRGARLAGLLRVPYTVDESVDPYAQVVENVQREDLSPFELAAFVAKREKAGDSRVEIARRLGLKSRSYVTELAELASAPQSVRSAYDSGQARDVRLLYAMARLARRDPAAVEALVASGEPITRERVAAAAASRDAPPAEHEVPAGAASALRVAAAVQDEPIDPAPPQAAPEPATPPLPDPALAQAGAAPQAALAESTAQAVVQAAGFAEAQPAQHRSTRREKEQGMAAKGGLAVVEETAPVGASIVLEYAGRRVWLQACAGGSAVAVHDSQGGRVEVPVGEFLGWVDTCRSST